MMSKLSNMFNMYNIFRKTKALSDTLGFDCLTSYNLYVLYIVLTHIYITCIIKKKIGISGIIILPLILADIGIKM